MLLLSKITDREKSSGCGSQKVPFSMASGDTVQVKVIVLGLGAVGKSALSIRFVQNQFAEDYDPTIMDTYTKSTTVDDRTYMVNITDTAGMDDNIAVRPALFRQQNSFVLVYAINDAESFDFIRRIHQEIVQHLGRESYPCVLCGNKADLADSRAVTEEEGQKMAREINAVFLETSAKTGKNVNEAVTQAIREFVKTGPASVTAEKKSKGGGCFGRRSKR